MEVAGEKGWPAAAVGMDAPVALLLGGGGPGPLAGETESGIVYVDPLSLRIRAKCCSLDG